MCRDAACSYGWLGNVAVVIGHAPPTAATVPNYKKAIADLATKYPEGIGLVTIVQTTSTPEPDARDAILHIFRDFGRAMNACLFVDEAIGFQAAIHRSIGAGLILASGKRSTIKITGSLSTGLDWFISRWRTGGVAQGRLANHLSGRVADFYTAERGLIQLSGTAH